MNPETEQNINEAIDWLQATGASIQDFALEQTPLYCQEVVAWTLWSGIIGSIVGILMLVLATWLWKRLLTVVDDHDEGSIIFHILAGVAFTIFGFAFAVHCLPDAIKASVAPRVVIIEHLKNLK